MKRFVRWAVYGLVVAAFVVAVIALLWISGVLLLADPLRYVLIATATLSAIGLGALALIWAFDL